MYNQNLSIKKKKKEIARHQWLIPIILATQEAETRRINCTSKQFFRPYLQTAIHKKGW
jgi:hypothetical protein